MPNRLINENSPYLLQHMNNPVEWYPWGAEALEKARREDKPIFLSIGYAACHWCHVMAHESFEDPETAAIMNEHFVNIKVDREERLDLDSIYMNAVVSITGQGGWPLSVFLSPTGEPFYGGTYFPPVRRYNIPAFREILLTIHRLWNNDRQQLLESGQKITEYLQRSSQVSVEGRELDADEAENAALTLAQTYDWKYGGWGNAPKFPQPMAIEFLLRKASTGDHLARDIALHALKEMAKGGMYDVVGGGFARYSTDNLWRIPHFEKMLYDNALLSQAYLHAYLVSGEIFYRQICEQTLDFVLRELTHPAGGFYSSLDADSEGEEGKYYTWTPDQITDALPDPKDAELIITAYNITPGGNFEGTNVLQHAHDDHELATRLGLQPEELSHRLASLHNKLLSQRENRIRPSIDDKVLVSWNAWMQAVFSEAGRYLRRQDYIDVATRNAHFLIDELSLQGRLMRSWRNGKPRHNAYLEDYASLSLALLSLYQSNPDPVWLAHSLELAEYMLVHFRDPAGGFLDTSDDHDPLLTRPKDLQDNATPSGNSTAAMMLLLLSEFTARIDLRTIAEEMLSSVQGFVAKYPTAFANWLCAIDFALHSTREIAILGEPGNPATLAFLSTLWEKYRPHLVLAYSPEPSNFPALLSERTLHQNQPTAYICQNFVCNLPINDPILFKKTLDPDV